MDDGERLLRDVLRVDDADVLKTVVSVTTETQVSERRQLFDAVELAATTRPAELSLDEKGRESADHRAAQCDPDSTIFSS